MSHYYQSAIVKKLWPSKLHLWYVFAQFKYSIQIKKLDKLYQLVSANTSLNSDNVARVLQELSIKDQAKKRDS